MPQQKPPDFSLPKETRSRSQMTTAEIGNKKSAPIETLRKGEDAHQKNRETWDWKYAGQFIAIHAGAVVAAASTRENYLNS